MDQENPTSGDAGASISERLESYLAASDGEPIEQKEAPPKAEENDPPAEENAAPEDVEATPDDDAQGELPEPQLSLSDLAKYLGVEESALDVSDAGDVLVKTKIDGKEGTAKFQELVKSYQIQGHADAKAREAAEMQKAIAERAQQFETYAKQQVEHIESLANVAHQELVGDFNAIDWNALATNDPALFVQQKHLFEQRQAKVNALLNQSRNYRDHFNKQNQYRQEQYVHSQAEVLPKVIPEWADSKVRETERNELIAWAKGRGLTDADIAGVTRADVVAILRDAWLYSKGKAAANVAEKRVRAAPKLVKPGQAQTQTQRQQDSLRDLKQQIRKTGGKGGIAEYLLASGKV